MTMEAFEQFVAVAMEEEGLVVSSAVKFFVKRKTKKQIHDENQEHGYEVDLVGANSPRDGDLRHDGECPEDPLGHRPAHDADGEVPRSRFDWRSRHRGLPVLP